MKTIIMDKLEETDVQKAICMLKEGKYKYILGVH